MLAHDSSPVGEPRGAVLAFGAVVFATFYQEIATGCARDDMGAKAQKKTQNAPFRRILRKKIFAYRCSIQSAERALSFSSMKTRALRSSSVRSWPTKDSQHRKIRVISGIQARAFSVGKT